jgi:formyltetrahydrofolate hydrolase
MRDPIIERDGTRVSHRDQVANSVPKGRDLESVAPSQAIPWYRNIVSSSTARARWCSIENCSPD